MRVRDAGRVGGGQGRHVATGGCGGVGGRGVVDDRWGDGGRSLGSVGFQRDRCSGGAGGGRTGWSGSRRAGLARLVADGVGWIVGRVRRLAIPGCRRCPAGNGVDGARQVGAAGLGSVRGLWLVVVGVGVVGGDVESSVAGLVAGRRPAARGGASGAGRGVGVDPGGGGGDGGGGTTESSGERGRSVKTRRTRLPAPLLRESPRLRARRRISRPRRRTARACRPSRSSGRSRWVRTDIWRCCGHRR